MKTNNLKIALPKGRLLAETADLLKRAGWGLSTYHEGTRAYRPRSQMFPGLLAKVFHEKDIPIQVAVGNYDLGICGLDWIQELLVKYPSSALVKLKNLGYGAGVLYMVASQSGGLPAIDELKSKTDIIRLASEYPNLAESFALNQRLRRFSVFPLWGAADGYPPETAELALISGSPGSKAFNHDLVPVSKVLSFGAYLIANQASWEKKDLSVLLESIEDVRQPWLAENGGRDESPASPVRSRVITPVKVADDVVRVALPDGHQQKPTVELLNKAGIQMEDYPSATGNRRPATSLEGVAIKVIRPQDMPLQVANGNFDLAVTGKDWLTEHLNQFPSSPVADLLDLNFGRVKIVAVIHNDLPVDDIYSLKQLYAGQAMSIRVASEYVNIADKYARDNHLGAYQVIPTWGASEAFLPEDADLLIENTETGQTLARHNLKIIDTLFESTGRLIGNRDSLDNPAKSQRIKSIIETLRAGL